MLHLFERVFTYFSNIIILQIPVGKERNEINYTHIDLKSFREQMIYTKAYIKSIYKEKYITEKIRL